MNVPAEHGPFCEACGDCLVCYGDFPCESSADGKHVGDVYWGSDAPELDYEFDGSPRFPDWPEDSDG
jgi:hypothetical protein